jgi:hypothetical protein
MTTARERWGWALLFGLATGLGVALATARTLRSGLTEPIVVVPAATTAVLLVALLLGVTSGAGS